MGAQDAWLDAKAQAENGQAIAHVAAYEHQRVVLRSAVSQYRGIIRDARNVDSIRIARAELSKHQDRLARLDGRARIAKAVL